MSRIMSGFLAVVVASTLAVALAASGTASKSTGAKLVEPTAVAAAGLSKAADSATVPTLMNSIDKLSPFIARNPDGTLSMAAPHAVLATIPAAQLAVLNQSLASVNHQVLTGKLTTSAGGFVQIAGANPLILSGGGRTYVAHYWWGTSYCVSQADLTNWNNGTYIGTVGILLTVINAAAGLSFGYLLFEMAVVDQWGGYQGVCVNLINNWIVTFTAQ